MSACFEDVAPAAPSGDDMVSDAEMAEIEAIAESAVRMAIWPPEDPMLQDVFQASVDEVVRRAVVASVAAVHDDADALFDDPAADPERAVDAVRAELRSGFIRASVDLRPDEALDRCMNHAIFEFLDAVSVVRSAAGLTDRRGPAPSGDDSDEAPSGDDSDEAPSEDGHEAPSGGGDFDDASSAGRDFDEASSAGDGGEAGAATEDLAVQPRRTAATIWSRTKRAVGKVLVRVGRALRPCRGGPVV